MYDIFSGRRLTKLGFLSFFVLLIGGVMMTPTVQGSPVAPKWSYDLVGAEAWTDTSSPALADVNGDGFLDIVVATNNGHIVVLRHDGVVLWDQDVSGALGQAANSLVIASSPAVADLDGDGSVEVVVGTGNRAGQCQNDGGIIVMSHTGSVEPGWPIIAPPNDKNLCSVFSSPALADLDNDGDLEVVAGSFNKRVLAYHHNGQLMAGFPPNSPHLARFPLWTDQLQGSLADTIWSSPAVADIDGDNDLEIFLGTDEGNYGNVHGGVPEGYWECPYPNVETQQYCGGSTLVLSHTGEVLRDSLSYILEHVQSTPAIADINQDGVLEIVYGTGTYYDTINNGGNSYANRLLVVSSLTGEILPGWNDVPESQLLGLENWGGGKVTSGNTPAASAIGDIAGDSGLEIVAVTLEGQLYAWFADGSIVPGFPMTPLQSAGDGILGGFDVGNGIILGDTDGDGKMEILLNKAWDVVIVDGNGTQLTSRDGKPIYFGNYTLNNMPAVGDIDNDGELELVSAAREVRVWDLTGSTAKADWPQYKQNAAGTSFLNPQIAVLGTSSEAVITLKEAGSGSTIQQIVALENSGALSYNWSVSSVPAGVSVNPTSGTVNVGQQRNVTVTIDSNSNINESFVITATDSQGSPALNSPMTVVVRQIVVDQIDFVYLPLSTK